MFFNFFRYMDVRKSIRDIDIKQEILESEFKKKVPDDRTICFYKYSSIAAISIAFIVYFFKDGFIGFPSLTGKMASPEDFNSLCFQFAALISTRSSPITFLIISITSLAMVYQINA